VKRFRVATRRSGSSHNARTYHLFCTQYCGTDHSHMIGDVVVLIRKTIRSARWFDQRSSLAQNGERLFASLSCAACHNTRPTPRTESRNVYGSRLTLSSGQQITAMMLICASNSEPVAAHTRVMRRSCLLSRADQRRRRDRPVEYIKNLDSDYRVQQTTASTTLLLKRGNTTKAPVAPGANQKRLKGW